MEVFSRYSRYTMDCNHENARENTELAKAAKAWCLLIFIAFVILACRAVHLAIVERTAKYNEIFIFLVIVIVGIGLKDFNDLKDAFMEYFNALKDVISAMF